MLVKHFQVFRWKGPQIGKALLLLLITSIVQGDMKAARVMITRFLYKCQDTAQIHRRGSSLPCSAPNLTSQINQTKSSREGSTNPDKINACRDLPHTGWVLQQLLFTSVLLAKKKHNITVMRYLKISSQHLKKRKVFYKAYSRQTLLVCPLIFEQIKL